MRTALLRWVKQPTTIHALAVGFATVVGIGTWLLSRNATAAAFATGAAFSIVAAALPDNSSGTDRQNVQQLVSDAVTALAMHKVAEMIPTLVADATRTITGAVISTTTVTTEAPKP